ncbi:o-succinylbenzoate synthase [Pontibacter sp. JH31]|uniref:O-succinylbenzoate synthase n=1 Tax=Pontibacter aquaedesilientis TaxID=2766980 RepID=A0ABR7XDD9_9BACT|nr:o-succinylbenzoate synthase [Pontibacter aquaedesilientis]MBD1396307.1 o-succinylbenzoate synthase [Pontibacter aquaedesilientis]
MSLQLSITPHLLQFKFDARTSRGAMATHRVYYLTLFDTANPGIAGVGECAPLPGLSLDATPDLEPKLKVLQEWINHSEVSADLLQDYLVSDALREWPALRFGLETALLDLKNGGRKRIYDNAFSRGKQGIPINGLVWMGNKAFMQEQIHQKLTQGYTCLKLKIGSLDFATELEILKQIREVASAVDLTIRVDANGAFSPEEAFRKLERLARYDIHSIEQPIRQGQLEQMQQLCAYTPIPIALDEELIGVQDAEQQVALLDFVKPQYIILKPTLVGGMQASAAWIDLAETRKIGWWMTSALESNIGLNAISQFTANYPVSLPQGLGTGQLYHNNIESPLQIQAGTLWHTAGEWASLPQG